jgi:O-antigen ligase
VTEITAEQRAPAFLRGDYVRRILGAEPWLNVSLVLLAGLLALTTAFSREFSVIGLSSGPVYVTEVLLLSSLGLALFHHGLRGAWTRASSVVPMVALLVLWLAGAIALARGLSEYGFTQTRWDVGLVEYSILLPLVALIANTEQRSEALVRALAAGGFCSVLIFGSYELTARTWGDSGTLLGMPQAGIGIGASFYLAWVASRWAHRQPTARIHLVLAPIAVLVVGLSETRGAWLAMFAALAVVGLLAPTLRAKTVTVGAAILALPLAVGGTALFEATLGERNLPAVTGTTTDESGQTVLDLTQEPDATVGQKLVGAGGGGSEGANVRWRLAYWGELISRAPDEPLTGVGFGRPAAFVWEGTEYDFRRTDDGTDVYGPHNGFIDVLYRMGIPAFGALIAIIGVAGWRLRGLIRSGPADPRRARQVTVAAMFAAATVTILFNDALRVPYLAILFWAPLALLLVEGRWQK